MTRTREGSRADLERVFDEMTPPMRERLIARVVAHMDRLIGAAFGNGSQSPRASTTLTLEDLRRAQLELLARYPRDHAVGEWRFNRDQLNRAWRELQDAAPPSPTVAELPRPREVMLDTIGRRLLDAFRLRDEEKVEDALAELEEVLGDPGPKGEPAP